MSLIYEALQQTAEQAVEDPVPSSGRVKTVAENVSSFGVSRRPRWVALVAVAIGVLGGVVLGRWGGWNENAAADAAAPMASPVVSPLAQPSFLDSLYSASPVAPAGLPRMMAPLPTAAPRLTLTYNLPAASSGAATQKVHGKAPVDAPLTTPSVGGPAVERPAPAEAPARSSSTSPVSVKTGGDLSEHFDGMNQSLENKDNIAALRHLQVIQDELGPTTVARLRAEAWYAYRSGDLMAAQKTYRRLLERLPGDEQAAVTLASIEKKNQNPDQAKEILTRSLRLNPGSPALRAAFEQLALSEKSP